MTAVNGLCDEIADSGSRRTRRWKMLAGAQREKSTWPPSIANSWWDPGFHGNAPGKPPGGSGVSDGNDVHLEKSQHSLNGR